MKNNEFWETMHALFGADADVFDEAKPWVGTRKPILLRKLL